MPSGSTGKLIERLRVKSRTVSFYVGEKKYDISHDAYVEFMLYEGKVLSPGEFEKMLDFDGYTADLRYARKLLARGEKSIFETRAKLKDRGAKRIDEIIERLERDGLLDDETFARDYADAAFLKGRGYIRIKRELIGKGVAPSIVRRIRPSIDEEKKRAESLAPALAKKYSGLGERARDEHVRANLMRQGYSFEAISAALSRLPPVGEAQELASLRRDYERALLRHGGVLTSHAEREKVLRYLLEKGYRSADVRRIMREKDDEVDQGS